MNHHPWVLLDTETNGIAAPIYVVEIGAQKMNGWLEQHFFGGGADAVQGYVPPPSA